MSKKIINILIVFAIVIFVLPITAFGAYNFIYQNKIFPNVRVANIDLGGLTKNDARNKINNQINLVKNSDIEYNFDGNISTIKPEEFDVKYDLETSLNSAYSVGRKNSYFSRAVDRFELIFNGKNLLVAFSINRTKLDNFSNQLSKNIDILVRDASLKILPDKIELIPSNSGVELDKYTFKQRIISLIGNLEIPRLLILPIEKHQPALLTNNLQPIKNQLDLLLSKPITLKSDSKNIVLEKSDLINWIDLVAYAPIDEPTTFQAKIVFNEGKIKSYIKNLSGSINQDPINAKLATTNGKITALTASQKGYKLDEDQTLKLIVSYLYAQNNPDDQINLPVSVTEPEISQTNISNLGINELIGTGTTNYKGSPTNRKFNIQLGANLLNGVIIKPSEEFSVLKNLAPIDESHGFKKELVIKGNSTVPEVGGGLCQVSTTVFRAALNAGLKITERVNHKYRVSYYEPPVGLDATIYDPAPDFKFLNDTPGYILVQGSVKDDKITFELYGTKDARVSTISDPILYDSVSPPATQYIDDPTMDDGQTKYIEKAHTGVTAKVTYQVKRDDKVINEQTFISKYVAWGAIIKRGTKKAEQPAPAPVVEPTPAPVVTDPAPVAPVEPAPAV
jgi:vancomycin resistance protein YoaR